MNWIFTLIDSPFFPLVIVLLVILLAQLIYYWLVFGRLAFYNSAKRNFTDAQPPVSVIICAKNEYHNLVKFLPIVLEQNYPEFEVIVVNDASDDDTYYLLKELSDKYSHLKVVHIRENLNFFTGKKFPLSLGIKSAIHENLLFTDADCCPAGPDWISSMQKAFTDKTEIVLGYGPYFSQPGLLNKLIRFDTLHVAMQYMGMALSGSPYMGVGRNLAYHHSLFYKAGGFIKHYKLISGDDDLFINQVSKKANTRIQPDPAAFTYSKPKQTLGSWIRQKRRHLTTGGFYKKKHKFILGLFFLTQIAFYIILGFLAFSRFELWLLGGIFLIRLISQLIIYRKIMVKLNEKGFLLWIPFFEIFLLFINLWLGFIGMFSKKTQW
jgi:cellulose synthase/poly-beta-1,6-N-acetylglucosamine synthase-like glycosyltransferase